MICRDEQDRLHVCELLGEVVARFRVRPHARGLMDNHYCLVVELTEPDLSRRGQGRNVSSSVWFNRRHGRSGHLFQGRFKSAVVEPVPRGLELSRHVHLNPVRVGRRGLGQVERQRQRAGGTAAPEAGLMKAGLARLRRYQSGFGGTKGGCERANPSRGSCEGSVKCRM